MNYIREQRVQNLQKKQSDKDMKDFTLQLYLFKDSIKTVSHEMIENYWIFLESDPRREALIVI